MIDKNNNPDLYDYWGDTINNKGIICACGHLVFDHFKYKNGDVMAEACAKCERCYVFSDDNLDWLVKNCGKKS